MGTRLPGSLGLLDVTGRIDPGTLIRVRSDQPGVTNGIGISYYAQKTPILVGKPPREPGRLENGTVFEDMLFGDDPVQAAELKKDPVFQLPDAELEQMGKDLMNSVSTTGGIVVDRDLKSVAFQAWERFCLGVGGTFSSSVLTKAVDDHDKTTEFCYAFIKDLRREILNRQCDLTGFVPLPIGRYAFDSLTDKVTGLGILIHDIWSLKAELRDYQGAWDSVLQEGAFYGTVVFTLTDDFGLDWNDIVLHGNDHKPPTLSRFNTGDRFKAWYILQHFRKAKPFFIEIVINRDITDGGRRRI